MNKRDFRKLIIWQKADQIFDMVVTDIKKFPKHRIAFSLADQWFRSVGSISANIAEGYGRGNDREFQRSLIIVRGEIAEAFNWAIKIAKVGYISQARLEEYDQKFEELSKILTVFIGEIRKRLR